jgi:two-component system, NtrC family, response regulator HydG
MYARLIAENGDCSPALLDLSPAQPATLGRSRENAIVVRSDMVSRLHAKVYYDEGRWMLRDFGLNGTRVGGRRISGAIPLDDGSVIQLGEVSLRFVTNPGSFRVATMPSVEQLPAPISTPSGIFAAPASNTKVHEYPIRKNPEAESADPTETHMRVDELTALCRFMTSLVTLQDQQEMIRQTLRAILNQTTATVAGYLSLDPREPTPKVVLPETAPVDLRLSRRLTEKVRETNKMVWLYGDEKSSNPGESLHAFTDAVCVPLTWQSGELFAALHLYRSGRGFADQDVRFLEAAATFLAKNLEIHRNRRKLEAENQRLRGSAPVADELIGESNAIMNLRAQIARAALQPFTVLINGESGSGKELVAQALHHKSPRANGPLVVVNCAAIAPTLLEAELFGYRKGAFSGADRDHPGLFEQADEGTLFLDEVGELSLECQAKLLRVIESKAFRPVGATRDVKVDVRVVAATHRDLEQEVKATRFRQDLLFRLKVINLRVPSLREHSDDIPELARFFLERLSTQCRRNFKLTPIAMQRLEHFSWPGNVRQLRAVLESAAVMSETDIIDAEILPIIGEPISVPNSDLPNSLDIDDLETWAIRKALQQTGGNVSQSARLLGMSRDTLHTKLKKKGIDREAVLQSVE